MKLAKAFLMTMARMDDLPAIAINKGTPMAARSWYLDSVSCSFCVLNAVKNPLVWAPAVSVVLALFHVHLPAVVSKCCTLIGDALAGVSLFAMGLFLTGRKIKVIPAVVVKVGLKLIAQPAAMLGFAIMLGIGGASRREMILLGALPTGTIAAIFAMQFKTYEDETEAGGLLSAVASLATGAVCVALTQHLA